MAATDFVAPKLTGEKCNDGPPGLLGDFYFFLFQLNTCESEHKYAGSKMSAKEKYNERMKKLRDLHLKRNEARKVNHQEVRTV